MGTATRLPYLFLPVLPHPRACVFFFLTHNCLTRYSLHISEQVPILDCRLVLRGLRTLPLRMKKHSKNALNLARALQTQPKIEAVTYPGLPDHPSHAQAARQMEDFRGVLSIRLKGGRMAVDRFLSGVKIIQLAESPGGVESLICHPVTMTRASVPEETRLRRGIDDGLLRVSMGIEDERDLLADVLNALDY